MFIKYPSIENHYRDKFINRFIMKYGNDVLEAEYVIQEKLHGANLQLIFEPNQGMRIASRSQMTDEEFFGVGVVLATMDFTKILFWATHIKKTINLYGEFFGGNIQKGVEYGAKKIRFFDCKVDGEMLPQDEFEEFLLNRGLSDYLIPVIARVKGLQNALDIGTNFNTTILNKEDNECEGVVIKPAYVVIYLNPRDQEGIFYIKKKNDAFKEKTHVKKEPVVYSSEVQRWADAYQGYMHEGRIQSVYSKYGMISDVKDVGKYIGLVNKDAHETFFKEESDFDKEEFSKNEQKYIFRMPLEIRDTILKDVL